MVTTDPNAPPTRPPQVGAGGGTTNSTPLPPGKLRAWFTLMVELILAQVAMALGNIEILGIHPLAFLTAWGQALQQKASDAYTNAEAAQTTATAANTKTDGLIDAVVAGTTGSTNTGNDPVTAAFGLLGQVLAWPGDVLQQLFGAHATTAAQVTALQNNPGVSMSDVLATTGFSGYTTLAGTPGLVDVGYRTPAFSAILRNVGPATNKHGAHVVIDKVQRGSCALGIAANTAGTNFGLLQMYCGKGGDALRILTGSSPTLWVVQAQVDLAARLVNLDTFDFWYDPTTNTFHVLRNNQPTGLDWPDAGNIVTHLAGTPKNKIILMSNCGNDSRAGLQGPVIKQVVAYDK